MKLRIHGDSLRLRLTQAEVRRLANGQEIEETAHFAPGASLSIAVNVSPTATAMAASLESTRITMVIPQVLIPGWADSDQVALSGSQPAGGGRTLELLVEKDFQCLHSDSAENADAFPNPREAT